VPRHELGVVSRTGCWARTLTWSYPSPFQITRPTVGCASMSPPVVHYVFFDTKLHDSTRVRIPWSTSPFFPPNTTFFFGLILPVFHEMVRFLCWRIVRRPLIPFAFSTPATILWISGSDKHRLLPLFADPLSYKRLRRPPTGLSDLPLEHPFTGFPFLTPSPLLYFLLSYGFVIVASSYSGRPMVEEIYTRARNIFFKFLSFSTRWNPLIPPRVLPRFSNV